MLIKYIPSQMPSGPYACGLVQDGCHQVDQNDRFWDRHCLFLYTCIALECTDSYWHFQAGSRVLLGLLGGCIISCILIGCVKISHTNLSFTSSWSCFLIVASFSLFPTEWICMTVIMISGSEFSWLSSF